MKTAEATADIYKKAVEAFETALKTGVKIQEDSAQMLNDALKNAGAPQEWRDKSMASVREAIDLGTKNMDSAISQINKNAQNSIDLLKRAFSTSQPQSIADIQAKTSELWESTLGAIRENTQAVININTRTAEAISKWAKTGNDTAAQ